MANLIVETNDYLFYSLKYGCVLLDKNFENTNNIKVYNNAFFQGDDFVEIFESVQSLIKQNSKLSYINNFFSNYDDIMRKITEEDLEKIGIIIQKDNKPKP